MPLIKPLLLLLVFAAFTVATTSPSTLLIVVGDVQQAQARILYENLSKKTISHLDVHLIHQNNATEVIRTISLQEIPYTQKPRVLKLDNLVENTEYKIIFKVTFDDNSAIEEDKASFRTLTTEPTTAKVVVASCNCYYEDGDDTLWRRVLHEDNDRVGMVHMGDQVYADAVVKRLMKDSRNMSFEEIVNEFREVYRNTWSSPIISQVLRRGFNWMIPDDHEVINNLDKWFYQKEEKYQQVIMAGRQAFYEYQFQLLEDIYTNDSATASNGDTEVFAAKVQQDKIYFFKKFDHVCWAFLDFRMQKTFHYNQSSPLYGHDQFLDFKNYLHQECSNKAEVQQTLVITSIPMLFTGNFLANVIDWNELEKHTSHTEMLPHTLALLDMLEQYSKDSGVQVRFLSGDIHQFFFSKICKDEGGSKGDFCFDQMITSGITKSSTIIEDDLKLHLFHIVNRYILPVNIDKWNLRRTITTSSPSSSLLQSAIDLMIHPPTEQNRAQFLGKNYAVISISPSQGNEASPTDITFKWQPRFFDYLASGATSIIVKQACFDFFPLVLLVIVALVVGAFITRLVRR